MYITESKQLKHFTNTWYNLKISLDKHEQKVCLLEKRLQYMYILTGKYQATTISLVIQMSCCKSGSIHGCLVGKGFSLANESTYLAADVHLQ